MAKVADETASVLAELAKRIDDLAQRVLALEHASPGTPAASTPSAQESDSFQPPAVSLPAGTISILGRAVLGIALAYLFRAASESAILPRPLLVISAILYSSIWLILSVRLRPSDGFARAVYALTAVLILSPLLWEATVRFRILSPIAAAGALTAFTVFGLVLSLRFDLRAAPFILVLAAVPTAVALVIGAGAVTPFVFSLLVIALVVELGACRGNWPYLRPVIAAAADFIIWLMTYLLARPEGPLFQLFSRERIDTGNPSGGAFRGLWGIRGLSDNRSPPSHNNFRDSPASGCLPLGNVGCGGRHNWYCHSRARRFRLGPCRGELFGGLHALTAS